VKALPAIVVVSALAASVAGGVFYYSRRPPPPLDGPVSPSVVATVDGHPIGVKDVLALVEARRDLGPAHDRILAAPTPEKALALLKEATDEATVRNALEVAVDVALAEAAAKTQPPAPDSEIDRRLARRRVLVEGKNGPTLEQVYAHRGGVAALRHELAVEAALDEIVGHPSDEDLLRSFATRRDVFSGRRLKVSHMLFATEKEARDAEAELARGAKWEDLCRERSIDAETKKLGGDLDWARREGDLPDELSKAAFALEKGAVSGPVKTRYGWHLVRWTDEQPGKAVTLDDVRDAVQDDLAQKRRRDYVRSLRDKAKIDMRAR
jgi:parvulin-like peptidyl-prolyl isomerase